MFEDKTAAVLLGSMKGKVSSGVDTREGSFVHDAHSPAAEELADGYLSWEYGLAMLFAQTATGDYLDMRAAEFGVTRQQGQAASGFVQFTGSNGVVIPEGTQVETLGGMGYLTTEAGTIVDGAVLVPIEAEAFGFLYDVGAGEIVKLPISILGVTSVMNLDAVTGGADTETDEQFRERLLFSIRSAPTSGNASHYIKWAMEVPGVGRVKVFPLHAGPGTVGVVIIDSDMKPPGYELRETVIGHIEANRPIGALVVVKSAEQLDVTLALSLTPKAGYGEEQVRLNIVANLEAYLRDIAFRQAAISYAAVSGLVFNTPGVQDFSGLLLNGGMTNIPLPSDTVAGTVVPVLSSVTLV